MYCFFFFSLYFFCFNNVIFITAIRKVTKNFDSKASARSRFYEYLLPISMFKKQSEKQETSLEKDTQIVERINKITPKFLGTKNFHNYSRKMKAKSPQAKRFMIEFECKLCEIDDLLTEEGKNSYNKIEEFKDLRFLLFKIKGQSFIYHQIRKMIGVLIQCFQMDLPDVFVENSFSNNVVQIWLAPAQGLFLNRVFLFIFFKLFFHLCIIYHIILFFIG